MFIKTALIAGSDVAVFGILVVYLCISPSLVAFLMDPWLTALINKFKVPRTCNSD